MGWYGTYDSSKAEMVAECSKGALAKSLKGRVLWTVSEGKLENGETEKYIGCFLIEKRGGEWAYKPMSESCGPYYYDCPLKFLDMVPEPDSPTAKEWRAKVRAYHASLKRGFTVGETLKLATGYAIPEATITSVKPLRGSYNGKVYKLTPKHFV